MKVLIALLLMSSTFATVTEYTLEDSNTSNCLTEMTITEEGNDITLSTSNTLGAYFNKDSSEGNIVIEDINNGTQVIRSRNSSHGTKYKTIYKAVEKNSTITVDKVIKYGTFGLEKAENKLTLDFSGESLQMDIFRSYSETLGGGWEKSTFCTYNKVK